MTRADRVSLSSPAAVASDRKANAASPSTPSTRRRLSNTSPSLTANQAVISNGQWTIDLSQCCQVTAADFGRNYESVYIIDRKPRPGSYWKPAVCVPLDEVDESMPAPTEARQFIVRRLDDLSYHTVSPDDVVLIQPNAEPYQSFRAAVPRFCQVKEMRLALDFIRYFKLPQYMRWDKFGQTKLRSDTEFPAIPLIQEALADDEEELPMQTGADNPLVLDDQPLEEETSLTPDPSDMQTEDTSDLNHESLDSFTAVEEIETMKAASTDERAEFHSRLSDYFTRLIHRESGDANSFAMENELKNLLEEEGVTVQSSDGKSFKVDLFHFFQWMEPHSPSRESSEHQWAAYLSDASLPDDSQLVVELRNIYSKYLCGFKAYLNGSLDDVVAMDCVEIPISKSAIQISSQHSSTDLFSLPTGSEITPAVSSFSLALERPKRLRASTFSYGEKAASSSQELPQFDGGSGTAFGRRRGSVSSVDRPSRSSRNRMSAAPVKLPNLSEFTAIREATLEGSQDENESDLELSKVNLDNYENFRAKIKRLEIRLARKSLELWHEYGGTVDYCIDCGPLDFADPSALSKLIGKRSRSMSLANRGSAAYNCDGGGRTRRSSVQRRASFSGVSGSKRMRYRSSRDSLDDDEFYESDESSVSSMSEMDDGMDNQRFCPLLEAPEVTLEKEQELELFLLSFGTSDFAGTTDAVTTADGYDEPKFPADNPRFSILNELRPIVDVQEQQMGALRQRYKELLTSLRNINSEIRDLKRRKKRLIIAGILPPPVVPITPGGSQPALDGLAGDQRAITDDAVVHNNTDPADSIDCQLQVSSAANALFFVPSLPSIPESIKGSPEQLVILLPAAQHSISSLSTVKSSESVDSAASKQRLDLLPPLAPSSVNTSLASLALPSASISPPGKLRNMETLTNQQMDIGE